MNIVSNGGSRSRPLRRMEIIMDRDNIKLVNVNTKNFDDLVDLEVNEDQKNYVASNVYSLAEAYATNADGICA